MKNVLGALLVLVLVICGAYLSYTFIPEVHDFISPSTKNDTTIEQRGVYEIKYVVAGREKSDLVKDYPFLMKKSGNYQFRRSDYNRSAFKRSKSRRYGLFVFGVLLRRRLYFAV